MSSPSSLLSTPGEPEKLRRAGQLHWFHWLVIALSLVVTFAAWYYTDKQVSEKLAFRFEREADQVIELVSERMQKYEDALWGGVGAVQALGAGVRYADWLAFAEALNIDRKYPGINGIGLIDHVAPDQRSAYLEAQRKYRPGFEIYPPHEQPEYLPISYIEPVAANQRAVGLDIAHEANRYAAAKKARDTGQARITGPIVLVQDSQKTPGFLFYAPFYHGGRYATTEVRRQHFAGLVYAPFVVKKLMDGVLSRESRHVSIRITDGSARLYDELVATEPEFDPQPLFTHRVDLDLYGRVWRFDVWSSQAFRAGAKSSQPMTILVGGITIDALLLLLFLSLSSANRRAIEYTDTLRKRTARLERSNADLEQFAYVASHDLQEPLRMVGNFTQLLQQRYEGKLDDKADQYINFAVSGVKRMQELLNDLLEYSRLGSQGKAPAPIDLGQVCERACQHVGTTVDRTGATLDVGPLPEVIGDDLQLTQLFQNLFSNALKFRAADRRPRIEVRAEDLGDEWRFSVRDNGIGIEPQYREKIFVMFQRLHTREAYSGTGVGLAICEKVVIRHGGRIWVESVLGEGATFLFTLPKGGAGGGNVIPIVPEPRGAFDASRKAS